MRPLAPILAAVIALLAATSALASPRDELDQARGRFLAGEYARAQGMIAGLLYPELRLTSAGDLAEAHLLLGFCYYALGQKENARREFQEALTFDDSLRVDSTIFTEEAVEYFETIAEEQRRKAREDKEREEKARIAAALKRLVLVEPRRYWINFVPFGAGQFQNGQRNKGAFFFTAQAVTGGTSVAILSYQLFRYRLGGEVPADEVDQVRTLQAIQITTGALFYGFVAWGIIDSLANYEHAQQRKVDPKMLEELDIDLDLNEPEATSLRLVPIAGPEVGGLGVHLEF